MKVEKPRKLRSVGELSREEEEEEDEVLVESEEGEIVEVVFSC